MERLGRHHEHVRCEDAHKWPMRHMPHNFKEWFTGTIYVEGAGAVMGERTPDECIWYQGRCTGGIHGPWTTSCTSGKIHPA